MTVALIVLHERLKGSLSPWAASPSLLGREPEENCGPHKNREHLSLGTGFLLPVLLPVASSFQACRLQRRSSEAAAWTAALWKYRETAEFMNPRLAWEAAAEFRGLKFSFCDHL